MFLLKQKLGAMLTTRSNTWGDGVSAVMYHCGHFCEYIQAIENEWASHKNSEMTCCLCRNDSTPCLTCQPIVPT